MLSIENGRKLLGEKGKQMNDEEVKEIIETLYQIANVLMKNKFEVLKNESSNLL